MLIFLDRNLTYFATPKTGSTAVEMALRPHAAVIFAKGRKHINAQRYHNKVAPFLAATFDAYPETLAVMRDPLSQIRSWYRYRMGRRQKGTARGTHGMSFDDFVLAVISDDPPAYAGIGSQFNFLTSGKGELLIQHLFAYENQAGFRDFLSERLGEPVAFRQKNVSPPADAPISPEVEARLREARADEFALYGRLAAAGGYLRTDPAP